MGTFDEENVREAVKKRARRDLINFFDLKLFEIMTAHNRDESVRALAGLVECWHSLDADGRRELVKCDKNRGVALIVGGVAEIVGDLKMRSCFKTTEEKNEVEAFQYAILSGELYGLEWQPNDARNGVDYGSFLEEAEEYAKTVREVLTRFVNARRERQRDGER